MNFEKNEKNGYLLSLGKWRAIDVVFESVLLLQLAKLKRSGVESYEGVILKLNQKVESLSEIKKSFSDKLTLDRQSIDQELQAAFAIAKREASRNYG